MAKSVFYGASFPRSKRGLNTHLSQTAFLATTARGEFHPHRAVLGSSPPLWAGKLIKWRLVSKSPGSSSDSERGNHSQATGWSYRPKVQLGLISPSPAPWLSRRASWGGTGFRSLWAEPRVVSGAAGGRAAAVGAPRAQRNPGAQEKRPVPVAPQRLRLGLFSEVSHELTGRPPGRRRPGTSCRAGRGLGSLHGAGQQGSPRPSPARRPSGANRSWRRRAAGNLAGRPGLEACRSSSPREAGADQGGDQDAREVGPEPSPPGRVERTARRPRHAPAAGAPLSPGPFRSDERGAGCSRAGRPGTAGAGRWLRGGKPATRSRRRQTRKGGHSGLSLEEEAAAGPGACNPPRVELHWRLRRLRVPAAQGVSGAPGRASRAGPGPKNRSFFPRNGGRMGGGSHLSRTQDPGGLLCSQSEAGCPCSAAGLSHRSRRGSACISIHRTQTAGTIAHLLGSVFKYPTCVYADQSGVELGGWMITAKYTTYLDDISLQTHNCGIIFYLNSVDYSSLFFLL